MSRVPRVIVNPRDPLSIVEHLDRVQRTVDGLIEFGSPQDPRDPQSATRANGSAHNGTLQNVLGSWVEVNVEALDALVAFVHNLDAPVAQVAGVNQPNVRVLSFLFAHNGTGVAAGSALSFNYDTRDAASITPNSFPLRFYAAGRTVDAANPLQASLFFVPAVR